MLITINETNERTKKFPVSRFSGFGNFFLFLISFPVLEEFQIVIRLITVCVCLYGGAGGGESVFEFFFSFGKFLRRVIDNRMLSVW